MLEVLKSTLKNQVKAKKKKEASYYWQDRFIYVQPINNQNSLHFENVLFYENKYE